MDMTFKGGERLVGYVSPAINAGTRTESVVDLVFFLEVMEA